MGAYPRCPSSLRSQCWTLQSSVESCDTSENMGWLAFGIETNATFSLKSKRQGFSDQVHHTKTELLPTEKRVRPGFLADHV